MNIRYPIYEGVYRILTLHQGQDKYGNCQIKKGGSYDGTG